MRRWFSVKAELRSEWGFIMASPQKENGYTPIANEIMESLYLINLSPYEWRILVFIFRKTYGWKKPQDIISLSQFCEALKLQRPHICRSVKKLLRRNIITQTGNGYHVTYSFQKDYSQWKPLPNQVTVKPLPKQVMPLPKQVTVITQTGNSPLCGVVPKQAHTKAIKEKEEKEYIDNIGTLKTEIKNLKAVGYRKDKIKTMLFLRYPESDIDQAMITEF